MHKAEALAADGNHLRDLANAGPGASGRPSGGVPRPQGARPTPAYRPDIDGLRAVAVLPVVLFHAGLQAFRGGFVGVDIFFAISGFLITGILARSMEAGKYSVLEFYQRRARRIFPALAVMIAATLAAGAVILAPSEFSELGYTAASIGAFLSNFHFWKSVGYFEAGANFHPLLHTWSLAVEEQFYLLFPIALAFLHNRRNLLMPTLVTIFAVSLACSVVLVEAKPRMAFYLLPARAWELMAGGILALGAFDRLWTPARAAAAAALGLALIAAAVFGYSAATPFPGLAALPPVLGACLLIWARGAGVARVLAARPLVWIGLLSYSLYLWHVPVLEFARYLHDGPPPMPVALLLSGLSVLLAWLSLTFIERPFREGRRPAAANRLAVLSAAGLAAVSLLGLAAFALHGLPGRMSPASARILAVAGDERRHHLACMSLDEVWVAPARACRLGAAVAPTALLWGDSHALVAATAMEAAARRQNAAFLFAADADCPIGLGFDIDPAVSPGLTGEGHYRRCGAYNQQMLQQALSPQIRTVVLASRWTNWRIAEPANPAESTVDVRLRTPAGTAPSLAANRAIFESGFRQLVARLNAAGKRVVIVGPLPEPTFNVPHRAYVSQFGTVAPPAALTEADYLRRHATILAFFRTLSGQARFIWPEQALCRAGRCPLTTPQGVPLYFDHNHLSVAAAQGISGVFDPVFQP